MQPLCAGRSSDGFYRHSGLTLLEVLVYTGLMVVIGGPLISVVLVSSRGVAENSTMHQVAERNLISLYRVTQEVRIGLSNSVVVGNGGKSLTFTRPDSFDGTNIVPGPSIRYEFLLSPDELANAADDNGNGLVDEGRLLRTNLTTGEVVSLCENLDPAQSIFTWDTATVTMTVANIGRLSSANSFFGITRSLAMVPRN